VKDLITVRYDYRLMNDIMKIVKDMQPEITEQHFDTECVLTLSIRMSKAQELKNRLTGVINYES
jgi:putative IMPACT (imprinted ancient) family translation regulator